jgi:hypothetical protein
MAADFEYLDALSVDTERKIKLSANMWGVGAAFR